MTVSPIMAAFTSKRRWPTTPDPAAHTAGPPHEKEVVAMWTLSGFSDEISPDFETQCSHVSQLGLKYLELRSAWDVNVLDLDDNQLGKAKETLAAHRLSVSSIGSPIGRIFIDEDFEPFTDILKTEDIPFA